jgi:DNA-binding response OmpR family regulator
MTCDVLLIEDEPQLGLLISVIFKKRGIDLLTSETGSEGISIAVAQTPQLVLLDIRLPDMDGWDVFREIHEKLNPPPDIIFLSAATQQSDKQKAMDLGATEFISKPFETAFLVSVVKRLLCKNPEQQIQDRK